MASVCVLLSCNVFCVAASFWCAAGVQHRHSDVPKWAAERAGGSGHPGDWLPEAGLHLLPVPAGRAVCGRRRSDDRLSVCVYEGVHVCCM